MAALRRLTRVTAVQWWLIIVISLLALRTSRADTGYAQVQRQTFPETGKTVAGGFLDFWGTHGGLGQFGYPITNEMAELSQTNGKSYTVQYFERAVFEYHPELSPPNNVLLSLLGVAQYQQKYPLGAPGQMPNQQPGSAYFGETGKRIGPLFLQYWRTHGGLMQQGYPISDEFQEFSQLDGNAYIVQYFERAVFEYHSEKSAPNNVLLSQLGAFLHKARYTDDGRPRGGDGSGVVASGISATVVRVIDGDTIEVLVNGLRYRVRYIGIDTPETVDPNKLAQCFGKEASEANKHLVEGRTVTLVKDLSEVDVYGRLLRYVYVGDLFVNAELIRQGYARVATYPPDVRYTDLFLSLEREARAASRGLWGATCTPTPTHTAAPTRTVATPTQVSHNPPPTYAPPPTSSPAPTARPNPTPPPSGGVCGTPYDPHGPDRDCADFNSQAQAQCFFEAAGGPAQDPHHLDGDHDGIACEALP